MALPTRKQEDFRYSDVNSLAQLWPVSVESISLEAGETRTLTIVETGHVAKARELAVTLAAGASLDLRVLNAAAASSRIAVRAGLGERTRFTLGAVQLGGAGQTLEIVTEVTHLAPDAVSRQSVRSVVSKGATANYLGKVLVAKGADGTDGEQSVRAMLLDWQSAANAKPELEIHADDVKCAHGCAVGELDAAALFYLAQRGLPPEEAKKLMLQAFIAEAFSGAAGESALLATALDRLGGML